MRRLVTPTQVVTLFLRDLDDAIATTERMATVEPDSPHADHMRWAAEGLRRARRIMEQVIREAEA
jgi:hypothetical protein